MMKSLPFAATVLCLLTQSVGVFPSFYGQSVQSRYAFFIAIGLLLAGLALRWNRSFQALSSVWTAAICIIALLLSGLALVTSIPWFCLLGFAITVACILFEQLDRDEQPLRRLALFAIPMCCIPRIWESSILADFQSYAISTSSNLLRFRRIPHLASETSIELAGVELQLSELNQFATSWQFFLIAGIVWSVLMRRNLTVAIANCVSAVAWWWGWMCISLLLPAFLSNTSVPVLQVISYALAGLLFLSTERAIRGVFAPVTDGTGDKRQANPLIAIWNRMDSSATDHRDNSGSPNTKTNLPNPFAISLLALSLLGLALQGSVLLGFVGPVQDASSRSSSSESAVRSQSEVHNFAGVRTKDSLQSGQRYGAFPETDINALRSVSAGKAADKLHLQIGVSHA